MNYEPIPQPPARPYLGNMRDVDPAARIQSLTALAKQYGPFYKLQVLSRHFYVASSQRLVEELCDEQRFEKRLSAALKEIRAFAGDGLFTAETDDPNWAKAHRLLMPAFGPIAVRSMLPRMLDIASQMFKKWERFGAGQAIDVADNMTRLTLDTIALCAFDYRFNSFYRDEMHPFVAAMVGALEEAGRRVRRPRLIQSLMLASRRRHEDQKLVLAKVADDLLRERRGDPEADAKQDLLNVMLNNVDPVTQERLSDENIRHQLVTFLIAGHETTSGLLTFTIYLLLQNQHVLHKARDIVDSVLKHDEPSIDDLSQLGYVELILMEALRLWPTAPAFAVKPIRDTVLAGRYPLTTKDTILILETSLHRDPAVWGADADEFRPERFAQSEFEKLPPNSWKPFGNGARACIGRAFAMQEAQLVIAMLLRRFDFELEDPAYVLKISETLTIKPHDLKIRVRPRVPPETPKKQSLSRPLSGPLARAIHTSEVVVDREPLTILYGSNSGSCETLARRVLADAAARGYDPVVATLDSCIDRLSPAHPVVILCASYEGNPPDNARQFLSWIEGMDPDSMRGLSYALFGCGNRQWARTYQAVPKRIDSAMQRGGATRIGERGEADAGGDFFGAFDDWHAALWSDLAGAFGKSTLDSSPVETELTAQILPSGCTDTLQLHNVKHGSIRVNRELVNQSTIGARSKRHIEIELPEGACYRAGDYLSVLASNPPTSVDRALRRFLLPNDAHVLLDSSAPTSTHLPLGRPIAVHDLLSHYVELSQPATRAHVTALARTTRCPPEKAELDSLCTPEVFPDAVLAKRLSLLDLLERYQSCSITFAQFLGMLPAMRTRQYSISSSPTWRHSAASLTVAVVDGPSWSGNGRYLGLASSHLARLLPGDGVAVGVRPSQASFHLPDDPNVPLIMICAGSGVAPFRGFVQERAESRARGLPVGEALVFFGINHPDSDYLYREEFEVWEKERVVQMRMAFSECPSGDIKYVQHRVWNDRKDIERLFRQGAQVYLCGDGRYMAPAVRATLVDIYRDATGASQEEADAWAEDVENRRGRYVSDVFA